RSEAIFQEHRQSDHPSTQNTTAVYAGAQVKGAANMVLEGLVSKHRDCPYQSGRWRLVRLRSPSPAATTLWPAALRSLDSVEFGQQCMQKFPGNLAPYALSFWYSMTPKLGWRR